jgi:hypothetical protein
LIDDGFEWAVEFDETLAASLALGMWLGVPRKKGGITASD